MNCGECQERIALDAESIDAESPEVERHLETCAECREFRAGLGEVIGLLAETHMQAIGTAELAAVRERVRVRIAAAGRRWVPVWAGGLAAAIVLLAVWIGQRQERPVNELGRPVAAVAPVYRGPLPDGRAASSGSERSTPKRAGRAARGWQAKAPAPPKLPAEPLTVKLITDDPNVVIYWIVDAKGD